MPERSYPALEELISLPFYRYPCVSDDGRTIAYVKLLSDWKENAFVGQIWVYDSELDSAFPVTPIESKGSIPQWAPDSEGLAFLSRVGPDNNKKAQLFVKRNLLEAPIQLTDCVDDVCSYTWASDGTGLFFATPAGEPDYMKKRRERVGDIEYHDREYRNNCIRFVSIDRKINKKNERYFHPEKLKEESSKENKEDDVSELLIDGKDYHVLSLRPSRDGKMLLFSAAPNPNPEFSDDADFYALDLIKKSVRKLSIGTLIDAYGFDFSPDSSSICYGVASGDGEWYSNWVIQVLDLDSGNKRTLNGGVDESLSPIRWTERGILVSWWDRTKTALGLLDVEKNIITRVDDRQSSAYYLSVDRYGDTVGMIAARANESFDVHFGSKTITGNTAALSKKRLAKRSLVRWKSTDGVEIEGVLITPDDFDGNQKHPLLVIVHGGPLWLSLPAITLDGCYPREKFAEKGFVMLEPNYRGSTGYGESFRKLNLRNLGIGDYQDVISGVDFLIDQGIADPERIGIMGWSQGGYISAFCATYCDRFRAASVGAGISDWETYYCLTDIHQFTRKYLKSTPWDDKEIFEKTSPISYIKNAKTPTLIQHGDSDQRVPFPNALKLYQGLRDMGVEVELVVFKGMQHSGNKPGVVRAIMHQNFVWFCHHLLGEPMEDFHFEHLGKNTSKSQK